MLAGKSRLYSWRSQRESSNLMTGITECTQGTNRESINAKIVIFMLKSQYDTTFVQNLYLFSLYCNMEGSGVGETACVLTFRTDQRACARA